MYFLNVNLEGEKLKNENCKSKDLLDKIDTLELVGKKMMWCKFNV